MDAEWVENLMKKYSSRLLHYLNGHTHSREDAEDLLQDIFVSVYEHCSEFDPSRCNEEAWLYIIAKRKLVSYYRGFKMNDSIDEMEDFQLPGDNSMAQATNLMACRQAVAKALSGLDERSKDIVVLKYFSGLSYKEIGEKLGISEGNARVICSRALEKMQNILGDFEFSED
ncbi:MAG: sigma-70 family RNA polymerase sigma factor [Eubacteriales bacterium]|nr:sigma-70 family RNA polymerase sigma factor [Eubacteriales bacterium]